MVGDGVDLGPDRALAGLGEDRADRRGRHLTGVLVDHAEDVAQEVKP